jgi:hypothetical protein
VLQAQAQVVSRFRSGERNLLVATNIGSEGMDFMQCAAVVAFEPPPDLTSYIQVKGVTSEGLFRMFCARMQCCCRHCFHFSTLVFKGGSGGL